MANELRFDARADDAGLTLVELIVAMGLFLVFLSILVGGTVGFTRATTEARIDAQTSSQVGVAVQRVERSVRYANSLNYPGIGTTGAVYVEWRTDAVSAVTGVTTCTQLRYSPTDGTIAMRSWSSGAAATSGTWSVILRDLRGAASVSYPFMTESAGANSNYQGLSMTFATGVSTTIGTNTSATYYAKNSSVDSTSNATDASGQSQIPVCNPTGYRP